MQENRSEVIMRTSIVGIVTNVLLAIVKTVVGLISRSIAIVLDAVNNLTDAASSIITMVGVKYAGKQPDREHPFGHGRAEYFSSLVIAIIVLYAGITALVESVKAIFHPQTPSYAMLSLMLVGLAVAVKLLLGRYFVRKGEQAKSDALINSGKDATMDAVISVSTLIAAGVFLLTGLSLEAHLGAVIAVWIIKTAVEMLQSTISRLLGQSASADMARSIAATIGSFPQVLGVYDLVLHDYGPDTYQGSVHIEVPDTYRADALDELLRAISSKVYEQHHVLLTAVGVYSLNTTDPHAVAVQQAIEQLVLQHPHVKQMHGFYLKEQEKSIRFDLVIDFDTKDRAAVYRDVVALVQAAYPGYRLEIAMDTDFCAS